MILTIDATKNLNEIVQAYNWQQIIITIFIMILIIAFFTNLLKHRDKNTNYVLPQSMAEFLIFIFVIFTISVPIYSLTIGKENFYKTHVNPKNAIIRKETFDLSTNEKGLIKSYSNADDKKGTLRLKIKNRNEYVIVNKNNLKIYYNSNPKQTITLTTVTDYITNKKYYVSNNIKINNQSIEFK